MRITRLLAATALTVGLASAGAGTAQASEWVRYQMGPFADEASCNVESTWWHNPQQGILTGPCFYDTTPPVNQAVGWYYDVLYNID